MTYLDGETMDELRRIAIASTYSFSDVKEAHRLLGSIPRVEAAVVVAGLSNVALSKVVTGIVRLDERISDAAAIIPTYSRCFEAVSIELHATRDRGFPVDPLRGAALVAEESGELIKACLDMTRNPLGIGMMGPRGGTVNPETISKSIEEATQTAAVAIRMMYRLYRLKDQDEGGDR